MQDLSKGFLLKFFVGTAYYIAVTFFLIYFAEKVGYYDNIPLVFGVAIALGILPVVLNFILNKFRNKG